jgi:hypothetical protein
MPGGEIAQCVRRGERGGRLPMKKIDIATIEAARRG